MEWHVVFLELRRDSRVTTGISAFPLGWPWAASGQIRGLSTLVVGAGDAVAARGFSRVAAGFSSYDGHLRLPLGLALGSPIFPSGCEGKLGVALESLQGRRDLT